MKYAALYIYTYANYFHNHIIGYLYPTLCYIIYYTIRCIFCRYL